ncbi:hypothetical protein LUZ60_006767 [Juncus effusus]|nr:hypothetical protein LUZ60_006767 [Juncus effusus]
MPCTHQLKFDVKLARLANLPHQELEGNLFIRYSISTLDNRQIQVETKEIQTTSKSSQFLSEFASFECQTNSDPIDQLKKLSNVKFELRLRKRTSALTRIMARSTLLGTAEISWKDVVASREMSLEKWLKFSSIKGAKLPDLLVEMKINQIYFQILNCDIIPTI